MKTSPRGIAAIKGFESCVLRTYPDRTGKPTAGWGHLCTPAEAARYAGGMTQDEADALLVRDLVRFEAGVDGVGVELTQTQFDALVSLTFNEGLAPLYRDQHGNPCGVGVALREGRYADVPEEMRRWNKSVLRGVLQEDPDLVRRRAKESAMFAEDLPVCDPGPA